VTSGGNREPGEAALTGPGPRLRAVERRRGTPGAGLHGGLCLGWVLLAGLLQPADPADPAAAARAAQDGSSPPAPELGDPPLPAAPTREPSDQSSPGPPAQAFTDPAVEQLLSRMGRGLFAGPFFMAGRLSIERGDESRALTVRVAQNTPGTLVVRADGFTRHQGTAFLVTPEDLTAWFPRAELRLDLPRALGGERLFGSDFALDDLAVMTGGRARFIAWHEGEARIDGVDCTRLVLWPKEQEASFLALVRMWVETETAAPRRVDCVSLRGEVVRRLTFEGFDGDVARQWTAQTFGEGGGSSRLVFGPPEASAPMDPARFTPEGLRLWR